MVSTGSKDADKLPSAGIIEEESVKSTTSPAEEHRLQKLRLIICELSGVASDAQGFRNKLQTSCVHPGEPNPKEICLLCGKVAGKVAQVCAQQTH